MDSGCDRRTFLKSSLAVSAGLGLTASGGIEAQTAAVHTQQFPMPLPKRPLGKTGREVTIYGLGGLFTTSMHDRHGEAAEIVNRGIDLGVNYIDTSALYGHGASELNIGTVMRERRDEVLLASKSHDYTYDGTMALFEQSLRRLQTDHLDLYQHHLLGGLGQLEQLQREHSARQAFERLRDEGVVSYIGVTGHSSRVLADALEDYPYDCALITLNAAQEVMDDPERPGPVFPRGPGETGRCDRHEGRRPRCADRARPRHPAAAALRAENFGVARVKQLGSAAGRVGSPMRRRPSAPGLRSIPASASCPGETSHHSQACCSTCGMPDPLHHSVPCPWGARRRAFAATPTDRRSPAYFHPHCRRSSETGPT